AQQRLADAHGLAGNIAVRKQRGLRRARGTRGEDDQRSVILADGFPRCVAACGQVLPLRAGGNPIAEPQGILEQEGGRCGALYALYRGRKLHEHSELRARTDLLRESYWV